MIGQIKLCEPGIWNPIQDEPSPAENPLPSRKNRLWGITFTFLNRRFDLFWVGIVNCRDPNKCDKELKCSVRNA